MKRTITGIPLAILAASVLTAQAQVPIATYRWNFNQTNLNSTNYIFPTAPDGSVPDPAFTNVGVLAEFNGSGTSVNLLGADGSGVSSGTFANIPTDRAMVMPGSYGANSYIVRTPNTNYALTNWPNNGVITNFTLTCWAKENGTQGAFPRIVMFGANGQDAGSAGNNCFGLLFYNTGDLQLKIHNASNPNSGNGMSTSTQPLASALTNWVFIAVTYDSTITTGAAPNTGTNTIFYIGDRNDSLLAPTLAPGTSIIYTNYYATSINSAAPSSPDGPGYINFSPTALNGDGVTTGVSNVYVAIGNRYNGTGVNSGGSSRAFNGSYDDIRLFANQVLTLQQIEAVRTNAPPGLAGPLAITTQPQSTTVAQGQGASFTVVASDAPNRTYQWYRIPQGVGTASNAIAGATSTTFETNGMTVAANNGDKYGVLVHSSDPVSDHNGAGVFSAYATLNVLPTSAYVTTPGMLKFEYYANAGPGTSVSGFLNAPTTNYATSTPDQTLFMSSFDTRTVFPDDSHIGYFAQISGWITPTVTTNYLFFIRASDQADLLLSTDSTTNNLTPIAADTHNGGQLFLGPETVGVEGADYSFPVALVAGTHYAVLAHLKSSSGPNFLQVAWRMDSGTGGPIGSGDVPTSDQMIADRLQPIPASSLSTLALPLGTVNITQQPTASPSSTVQANSKITFSLGVGAVTNTGSGPLVIQWQKNGANIPGATGASYTTPYLLTTDSGAQFAAVVSLPGASATSSAVTVTVNPDTTRPTVLSASSDDSMYAITVQFSEPVDPLTALNPAMYSVSGGVFVSNVSYALNTNVVNTPPYDAVVLSTSRLADGAYYTVSVSGVKDTAANTIAGGNTATFLTDGFASGFGKFAYFEDQHFQTSAYDFYDDNTVNGFVSYSPQFTNNDPDTIVYPHFLEMSPQGQAVSRSGNNGIYNLPPGLYGTKMTAIITPTNTANYVFYLATDDSGILWLSTDDNPANKHIITYCSYDANNTGQIRRWSSANSTIDEGTLSGLITIPGATYWPVVDGNNVPIITLTNGGRYYLEVDHRETAGFGSVSTVNWDGGTGVAPVDGTATVLTGDVIGWHFPQPQINSFAKSGANVLISWTNSLSSISQGVFPWPGVVRPETYGITPSFPAAGLQATPTISPATWTSVTNNSPISIPLTAPSQFFRIGDQ